MFVVYCLDKPNSIDIRLANRDAHLAYNRAKIDKILIGGPILSDDGAAMIGSMLVYDFETRAEVEAHLAEDPYTKAGLFESVTVRRYKKGLP